MEVPRWSAVPGNCCDDKPQDLSSLIELVLVAQKCAAVLGERHAQKQRLKARHLNPLQRDAL